MIYFIKILKAETRLWNIKKLIKDNIIIKSIPLSLNKLSNIKRATVIVRKTIFSQ